MASRIASSPVSVDFKGNLSNERRFGNSGKLDPKCQRIKDGTRMPTGKQREALNVVLGKIRIFEGR